MASKENIEDLINREWENRANSLEQVKKKLRSGWRNDEAVLNQYFQSCVTNWKLYKGDRTAKQALKVQALFRQATLGDNSDIPAENFESQNGKRWTAWKNLSGMSMDMAKRRFITYLAEINPLLIDVMPDEKPPIGFPLTRKGQPICAKCNTVVGCTRPLMDQNKMNLRQQLFENEELHEPENFRKWVQSALENQRCVWGTHQAISRDVAKPFMNWFNRDENRGFFPYDSNTIMLMMKELVTYHFELAYEMMQKRNEIEPVTYNKLAVKCGKLKEIYEELVGEPYIFEILCTRDNEICNQRRLIDNGKNHKHPVEIDPPTFSDLNNFKEAIELRLQCQKLGISPCTGVVTDIAVRCDIYRERIAKHFEALQLAAEAKIRNVNRAEVHAEEKKKLKDLQRTMSSKQLSEACQLNLTDQVLTLVKRGCNPNEESRRGLTPLLCFVLNNLNLEQFEDLIVTYKSNVNYVNKYGLSPLMMACRLNQSKLVHILMRNGAWATLKGGKDWTALHWCVVHSCEELTKLLLEYIKESAGDLLRAVRFLDARGEKDETPLMLAARRRNGIMCHLLTSLGANPNLRNEFGRTAAYIARASGWSEIADWLEKKIGAGVAKLQTFSDLQFEKQVRYGSVYMKDAIAEFSREYLALIYQGKNIGQIPLGCPFKSKLMVIERGDRAVQDQQLFVDNHQKYICFRSVINEEDTKRPGSSDAEHKEIALAKQSKKHMDRLKEIISDILSSLRKGFSNPNIESAAKPFGWTVLHCAAVLNDVRSIRLMVREGADPNHPNQNGTTPVMLAAQLNNIEALIELLTLGGDLQSVDNEGYTPFAYASSLPIPAIFFRNSVDHLLDGDADGPKPFNSTELIKLAITSGLTEVHAIANERAATSGPDEIENHFKLMNLLEKFGLTKIETEHQLNDQIVSSEWRLKVQEESKPKPDESERIYNLDGTRIKKEEDEEPDEFERAALARYKERIAQEAAKKLAEELEEEEDVLRCPVCTLSIPCSHFFKKATLEKYLEKKKKESEAKMEAEMRASTDSSNVGFKSKKKLKVSNRKQEILEEAHIADRSTDRNLTLVNTYREKLKQVEREQTERLLLENSEENLLLLEDTSSSVENTETNTNDGPGFHRPLLEFPNYNRPIDLHISITKSNDPTIIKSNETAEEQLIIHPTDASNELMNSEKNPVLMILDRQLENINMEMNRSEIDASSRTSAETMDSPSLASVPDSILKYVQLNVSPLHQQKLSNLSVESTVLEDESLTMGLGATDDRSISNSLVLYLKPALKTESNYHSDVSNETNSLVKINSRRVKFNIPNEELNTPEESLYGSIEPNSQDINEQSFVSASDKIESPHYPDLLGFPYQSDDNSTITLDSALMQTTIIADNTSPFDHSIGIAYNQSSSVKSELSIMDATPSVDVHKKKHHDIDQEQNAEVRAGLFSFQTGIIPDSSNEQLHPHANPAPVPNGGGRKLYLFTEDNFGRSGVTNGLLLALSPSVGRKKKHLQRSPSNSQVKSSTPRPLQVNLSGWLFQSLSEIQNDYPRLPSSILPLSQWSEVLNQVNNQFNTEHLPNLQLEPLVDVKSWKLTAPRCAVCSIGLIRFKSTVDQHKKRPIDFSDTSKYINPDGSVRNEFLCVPCLIRKSLFTTIESMRSDSTSLEKETSSNRSPQLGSLSRSNSFVKQSDLKKPWPFYDVGESNVNKLREGQATANAIASKLMIAQQSDLQRVEMLAPLASTKNLGGKMSSNFAELDHNRQNPTGRGSQPIRSYESFRSFQSNVSEMTPFTTEIDSVSVLSELNSLTDDPFGLEALAPQPNHAAGYATNGEQLMKSPLLSEHLLEIDYLNEIEVDESDLISTSSASNVSLITNPITELSNASSGTSISDVSYVNPFRRPKEMTLLPFLISKGHFDEAERTVRISFGKRAVDEGEGMHVLLRIFGYQAEMYKQLGLWWLALGIYLDGVDFAASLLGFTDSLTSESISLVTSCLRSMKCGTLAQKYISGLCRQLEMELLKSLRIDIIKSVRDEDKLNSKKFLRKNNIWVSMIKPTVQGTKIRRRIMNSIGIGGLYKFMSSVDAFAMSAKTEFISFCCELDPDRIGNYAKFMDYCFRLRFCDDPEVYRYLVQHIIQYQLAKKLVSTSELARLYRTVTPREHVDSVIQFLKYGTPIGIEAFDAILFHAMKQLISSYRSYVLSPYSNIFQQYMTHVMAEIYDIYATVIQCTWRRKLGSLLVARRRERLKLIKEQTEQKRTELKNKASQKSWLRK